MKDNKSFILQLEKETNSTTEYGVNKQLISDIRKSNDKIVKLQKDSLVFIFSIIRTIQPSPHEFGKLWFDCNRRSSNDIYAGQINMLIVPNHIKQSI